MSTQLRDAIYRELASIRLIDPHTHIDAHSPASKTLADILGYHYYTELAHSAGMPKDRIEEPGLDPKEKVGRLMERLGPISNTIQYSWFVEMARELLDFEGDTIDADNWEPLYDAAVEKMAAPDWAEHVLHRSNLDGVFLTNDFDDPLEGFDTKTYIPCLRTDDLVFHLGKAEVRQRLEQASGQVLTSIDSLRDSVGALFDHFVRHNAKACAISLPPDFAPTQIPDGRAATALQAVLNQGPDAAESHHRALANFVFWTLAQRCRDYRLPFDLMIGVNRGVYGDGVYQGQDLYDSRVSLIQYRQLFNAFPEVTFPISVLASVTNQELVSYAWIFPNVVTNGHWWYSNTPTYIEHDAAARLEAVPRTKQVGYYSDMYKLEFALPKFNMYKRILAKILAERFVIDRGWSEDQAVALGRQVLKENAEAIFLVGEHDQEPYIPPQEIARDPRSQGGGSSKEADSGPALLGAVSYGSINPEAGEQFTIQPAEEEGEIVIQDDAEEEDVAIELEAEEADPALAATVDLDAAEPPSDPAETATVEFDDAVSISSDDTIQIDLEEAKQDADDDDDFKIDLDL